MRSKTCCVTCKGCSRMATALLDLAMKFVNVTPWAALLLLLTVHGRLAAQPPSYAKQVKPFLAKYCLECHNADDAKGGLVMDTVAALRKGGDNGPVLVPGKPEESRLVLLP